MCFNGNSFIHCKQTLHCRAERADLWRDRNGRNPGDPCPYKEGSLRSRGEEVLLKPTFSEAELWLQTCHRPLIHAQCRLGQADHNHSGRSHMVMGTGHRGLNPAIVPAAYW